MLKDLIDNSEKILIKGQLSKNCYVLESIFNPMLIVSIVLAVFDCLVFYVSSKSGIELIELSKLGALLLIHLTPVYIYVIGIFLTNKKYKNMECIITTKGIYVSKGKIFKKYEIVPTDQIMGVRVYKGMFDKLTKSGDIVIARNTTEKKKFVVIEDLDNYEDVYNIINKLIFKQEHKHHNQIEL